MGHFEELLRLAEQGDAKAQYNLGVMYRKGHGVPQNDAEAVKWYRKSAEQGDAHAQFNLGFMYNNGKGVPQNDAEAAKWYRKAADFPAFLWLSFHSQWVLRPNPHRVFASRHGEGSP